MTSPSPDPPRRQRLGCTHPSTIPEPHDRDRAGSRQSGHGATGQSAIYRATMPTTLRRTLRYGALGLVAVLAAGILYTMFIYRSLNILTPPERLGSLGRTYQLSSLPPLTRDEIDARYPRGHREQYTLEHVSNLWPRHRVYQFQNDTIRGQATTSAYLEWGNRYISYSLSGGP